MALYSTQSHSQNQEYSKYLRQTLHASNEVVNCANALKLSINTHLQFEQLIQLDQHILNAKVKKQKTVFDTKKHVPIDTLVSIKGSARARGTWDWQQVTTSCGFDKGRITATSIKYIQ